MSEPTYRIDLRYDPSLDMSLPWIANVVRIADEQRFHAILGKSREEAISKARLALAALLAAADRDESPVFLTENGDILYPHDPLHSVKS